MSYGLAGSFFQPCYSHAAWFMIISNASKEYLDYLNSDAWKKIRHKRLTISGFRCEVCGTPNNLEVHHLTYANIFHERMEDLLPLCHLHHLAAEDLIDKGKIPRIGTPKRLRKLTLRNLSGVSKKNVQSANGGARNRCQEELLGMRWFVDSLHLERKAFKNIARKELRGADYRGLMMANAFALFDRLKRSKLKEKIHCESNPSQADRIAWLICNCSATD